MIIDEDVYLEHFGVKGMRWGVRKSDGKAGALSENQLALAVYGGVAVATILANSGVKYMDSGRREARQSKGVPFKVNPKLTGKKTVAQINKDVVKQINPGYGDVGTKMNCRRATTAYEMRRRGFDVKATKSKYATGQSIKGIRKVSMVDKSSKFESVWGEKRVAKPNDFVRMSASQKSTAVFTSLSKHPNGARGEIGSGWLMGGGHSQAWEIVNNKPVIFDTQNGKTYSSPKEYAPFTAGIREAAHTRLDNRQINDEFVRRWVTNV